MWRLICILLFSIPCFTMCSTNTNTREHSITQKDFIGTWSNDSDITPVLNQIKIATDTSIFVVCDQLGLVCKNVYHADTLYLIVLDSDQGRGFMGPKFFPPKPKSLFAKCFIVDSSLKIYYTQKLFRDNIKTLKLDTAFFYQNTESNIYY